MSNRLVHFEIPYDDGERARGFYEQVFGWQLMVMSDLDYVIATTGPTGDRGPIEPGYINGGMFKREGPFTGPSIVVDVADIEQALAAVEAAGGTTVQQRRPVGAMGWTAYFHDTEGNLIGLWQTAP